MLKGATPEAVAKALLQPRKPLKQLGKATGTALAMADRRPGLWHWVAAALTLAVALLVAYAASSREALQRAEESVGQWRESAGHWEAEWEKQRCDRLYWEETAQRNRWLHFYLIREGRVVAVDDEEQEFHRAIGGVSLATAMYDRLSDSVEAVLEEHCGKEYEPGS